MLTFSFDELVQIERTLERVYNAVTSLADSQTQQQLSLAKYIIAEVRHCAQTLEMPDELTRPDSLKAKAVDRLTSMMKQAKLSEEQIESAVEKQMDKLDKKLMQGQMTQQEYDHEVMILDKWSSQQLA